SSVAVSPREVWDDFVRERDKVTLKYVRFRPEYYKDTLDITSGELSEWMKAHKGEVDREYESKKTLYKGVKEQVRTRHILVRVNAGATEEDKALARRKADEILRRARGGADFVKLARELSDDIATARRGGDKGYQAKGSGVPETYEKAMFALADGQISDVVETSFGFHVIRREGSRKGDVPEDEARREVAEDLMRKERGARLAEKASADTLALLHSGL